MSGVTGYMAVGNYEFNKLAQIKTQNVPQLIFEMQECLSLICP